MALSALVAPQTDPTPLFEQFRGSYATELLTAAVAHFNVFGLLAKCPRTLEELGRDLPLPARSANVLVTALRAMGLLAMDSDRRLHLTAIAREHLLTGGTFDVGDYLGLAASSPGVLFMVERLKTNRPAGADSGTGVAFIFREGVASAMEQVDSARHLTMALAGRAKNVAPVLADRISLSDSNLLIDVGGGTGIYSIALLQKNPKLKAIVLDRPEVLKITQDLARQYGVPDRLRCQAFDMFSDPLPAGADAILLSNVLHDWDVADCRELVGKCASALKAGGRLLIHDVFLNDELDGPLPLALYSAALFTLTEGRAYSREEYAQWLREAGLEPGPVTPTLIHCGVLPGLKRE